MKNSPHEPPAGRRLATYTTHRHPDERNRVVARRWISFDASVRSVVRAVSAMVSGLPARQVEFVASPDASPCWLSVKFGTDAECRSHSVLVELREDDITPLVFDLARVATPPAITTFMAILTLDDGGRRAQKRKPAMSKSDLQAAAAPSMVL